MEIVKWKNIYSVDGFPYFNSFIDRFITLQEGLSNMSKKQTEKTLHQYFQRFPLDLIYSGSLTIIDPTPKEVPLIPMRRRPQMILLEIVAEYMKQDKPLYITIPKSRKEGMSTIVEAIFFSITILLPHFHALVVADKSENSVNIFGKTKLMYNTCPSYLKPNAKTDKTNQLVFEDNGSRLIVSTALANDAGRSWDFHLVHFSEVASFTNKYTEEVIRGSILNTLPSDVFTMVVFESTGRGEGGFFYEICMDAKNKVNDYELFFIPWYKSKINKIKNTGGKFVYDKRFGNEKGLQKKYGLSIEELLFRRNKLKNVFRMDINAFNEEYPSELKHCFQPKSQTAFDHTRLDLLTRFTTKPISVGYIDEHGEFVDDPNGWLMVWKFPEDGWKHRYNIGADTGGLYETTKKEADYSVGVVYDRLLQQDVAMIRGHIKPVLYAKRLMMLGYYYNKALLGIEINKWESEKNKVSADENVIYYLSRTNYPNLYYRTVLEKGEIKPTNKIGFHTNTGTRKILFSTIEDTIYYSSLQANVYVTDDDIKDINADFVGKINNQQIIREIKSIRVNPHTGKYEAQGKDKDDSAMAFGISIVIGSDLPAPYKYNKAGNTERYDGRYNVRTLPKTKIKTKIKTRGII